jgi:apolipoprotein N-acyltransferase
MLRSDTGPLKSRTASPFAENHVLGVLSFIPATKEKTTLTPSRLRQWFVGVSGSRRAGIAIAAGAFSAASQAPLNFWPILFVTFPLMVWLIDGAPAQRWRGAWVCAVTGWCFGFGYFIACFYWVGHAFLVDADTFGWLLPVAVIGGPAYIALYTAIGFAGARLLWRRGALRILAFAIALTVAEWLRGHALTGFPWNAFGYALTWPLELAQTASVIGIWGLTFIVIAVFASPATLTDKHSETARPWLPMVCALVVLLAMFLFGLERLLRTPTRMVDGVELRIMQPNLQQDAKFNYSAKAQVMEQYITLSSRKGNRPRGLDEVTHLIWPESAFPFYLNTEPDALAQIASLLPEGTVLITGADRTGAPPPGAASTDARTSIYVIDHQGAMLALYDKVHLVPFGEYLPFQRLLERLGLSQLTKVTGGLIAGERRRPMVTPRAPPALPLLCYEVIFPNELAISEARPGWLLNLTNDGWFGISSGPHQHFAQARLRAVEQGLPLVRAANTGISAVIDPLGRVVRILPLGTEGLLDGPLPQRISPTIYSRFGDLPAAFLVAIALILVLGDRIRNSAAERRGIS